MKPLGNALLIALCIFAGIPAIFLALWIVFYSAYEVLLRPAFGLPELRSEVFAHIAFIGAAVFSLIVCDSYQRRRRGKNHKST